MKKSKTKSKETEKKSKKLTLKDLKTLKGGKAQAVTEAQAIVSKFPGEPVGADC